MKPGTITYDQQWKLHTSFEEEEEPNPENQKLYLLDNSNSDVENQTLNDEDYDDPYQRIEDNEVRNFNLSYLDESGIQLYLEHPNIAQLFAWILPSETFQHITDTLNNRLITLIEKDSSSDISSLFSKKRFKDSEVKIWLGLHVWFGLFRFPELRDYWHAEVFLKGGFEICMQEGRFKFLDANCLDLKTSNIVILEIKKKFRKFYKPDQELILVKNNQCTFYLFDSQTLFLLDLALAFAPEDENQTILSMLQPFINKNHIVFFAPNILNSKLIRKLHEYKIYPVGEQDQDANLIEMGKYQNTSGFMEKDEFGALFFYPKLNFKDVQTQSQYQLVRATKQIAFIEIYQSQFYKNQLIPYEERNRTRIIFEEYFEGCLYNLYTFLNHILSPKKHQEYKDFRIEVGKILIGEKWDQIEKDRAEIKRKQILKVESKEIQTEKLQLGLLSIYDPDQFHTPYLQENNSTVKYCVVCIKYEGLSKSLFRCLVCESLIKQGRIHLCVFPCFELFHRNPSEFIKCDIEYFAQQGQDQYFKLFNPLNEELIKPTHKNPIQQPISEFRNIKAGLNIKSSLRTIAPVRKRGRKRGGKNFMNSFRNLNKRDRLAEIFEKIQLEKPSRIERLPLSQLITPPKQVKIRYPLSRSKQQERGYSNIQINLDKFKPIQSSNYKVITSSQKEPYKMLKDQKMDEKLYNEIAGKDSSQSYQSEEPKQSKYQMLRQQLLSPPPSSPSPLPLAQKKLPPVVQEETKSPFEIFMERVKKQKGFSKFDLEEADQA